ncbi:BON domain-containing protein [Carboxydothermus hydrogenoformans]|uniref:Putative osmotically inducible protein n=1 Tax=Carboxydothermus hydrogenoformans (strain ATCC BAA-161 / DSM 6008 / Z-2901) TaxID=246194 RepID=Q3AG06_CARHZ|nr:BON domain-containing protein [Carboxydothermus hydrogenoformans]ABB14689.1 putative osmotically inducible protein [Carboxydothermus hydrogenoformans Z-2901]
MRDVDFDRGLRERIEEALLSKLKESAIGMNIDVKDGVVKLQGTVDVLSEKKAAEEIIHRIPGVKKVENELTVALDNGSYSDREIEEELNDKLANDPRIEGEIGAKVFNGIVTLQGRVDAAIKEFWARQVAERTRGVVEVRSQVEVLPEMEIDDSKIANEISRQLNNSLHVNRRDIIVEVVNGEVTLKGVVDTPEQALQAELIALGVKGVKRVEKELEFRHGEDEGDKKLTNELREALGKAGLAMVRAVVVDGIAFLHGKVGTPDQRHRAEEVAAKIEGIREVHNAIYITVH